MYGGISEPAWPAVPRIVCIRAAPHRGRIYRRQQGIRAAILSKRDLSQIRKFVRGCAVYQRAAVVGYADTRLASSECGHEMRNSRAWAALGK